MTADGTVTIEGNGGMPIFCAAVESTVLASKKRPIRSRVSEGHAASTAVGEFFGRA